MADGFERPTLIVVSRPTGTGKTTLAHEIARGRLPGGLPGIDSTTAHILRATTRVSR